ncbi:adenosylcobinamide amidohydrolase [uncultured Cohaesibacter sp.]|uniref:adenosylcobinamide amidohydrolase n=1 Tax=uncultured Cohaesibacter sp. TaxID=1002546 RepID=UPI0029C82643|nr:adenosylcobinamide amidohydrolase [uncultured Cohaesibacter sp.]
MSLIASIDLDAPWLSVRLAKTAQIVSWAVNRPGLVQADQILWREVKNQDLPLDVDPNQWLGAQLKVRNSTAAVTMLTSCDIRNYCVAEAKVEDAMVTAIVTVGLSNAERVGARVAMSKAGWGTINLAVIIEQGLTEWALYEAMSIATEARTTAVLDAQIAIQTGRATGTGTDCVAVAAPHGDLCYSGLHTALGEAIGKAVYRSSTEAIALWRKSRAGQAF